MMCEVFLGVCIWFGLCCYYPFWMLNKYDGCEVSDKEYFYV